MSLTNLPKVFLDKLLKVDGANNFPVGGAPLQYSGDVSIANQNDLITKEYVDALLSSTAKKHRHTTTSADDKVITLEYYPVIDSLDASLNGISLDNVAANDYSVDGSDSRIITLNTEIMPDDVVIIKYMVDPKAGGASPTNEISFKAQLKDPDGNPLSGAKLTLTPPGGKTAVEANSDASGDVTMKLNKSDFTEADVQVTYNSNICFQDHINSMSEFLSGGVATLTDAIVAHVGDRVLKATSSATPMAAYGEQIAMPAGYSTKDFMGNLLNGANNTCELWMSKKGDTPVDTKCLRLYVDTQSVSEDAYTISEDGQTITFAAKSVSAREFVVKRFSW